MHPVGRGTAQALAAVYRCTLLAVDSRGQTGLAAAAMATPALTAMLDNRDVLQHVMRHLDAGVVRAPDDAAAHGVRATAEGHALGFHAPFEVR